MTVVASSGHNTCSRRARWTLARPLVGIGRGVDQ